MARLTDPIGKNGRYPFRYRNSANTDVAETIRREYKRREALEKNKQESERKEAIRQPASAPLRLRRLA